MTECRSNNETVNRQAEQRLPELHTDMEISFLHPFNTTNQTCCVLTEEITLGLFKYPLFYLNIIKTALKADLAQIQCPILRDDSTNQSENGKHRDCPKVNRRERGGHDEKVNVCHSKLGGANWKLHAQTRAFAMNIQMSDCWSRCNPVSAEGNSKSMT